MPSHRMLSSFAASALLLFASLSRAQCAKDTECKGERVCEAGKCVEAAAVAPAEPSIAPAPASPVTAAGKEPPPEAALKPKMQRHSTGMMVGGIVMVSLAPVALIVAGVARLGKGLCNIDNSERACDNDYDATIYGSLLSGVVLLGAGIPLIVVGAKKEPVDQAAATPTISPWLTPSAAGLSLRVEM